jgi:hypothetical protein
LVERFTSVGIDLLRTFGIPGTSRIFGKKSDCAMAVDDAHARFQCMADDSPQFMADRWQSPLSEPARAYAEICLKGAHGSHAWGHTPRVLGLCERIGPADGAVMEAFFKRHIEEFDGKR